MEDDIYIKNAGLVILNPFLIHLFARLNLTEDGVFKNDQARYKAVNITQFVVSGENTKKESELRLNKIICGLDASDVIPIIEIGDEEEEAIDALLNSVIQQWSGMNNTTIDGLRHSFLMREGLVTEGENEFTLKVHPQPFDLLLERIPWHISFIKLSWMKKPLRVEW